MLIVLCHPSDVVPEPGERERWVAFFEPSGDDPSNLSRYFSDLSLGRLDAASVRVTDWLDAGHPAAGAATVGGGAQRDLLGAWGESAAGAAGYDLGAEDGVVFGWNIDSDHGSIGGGRAVLAYRAGRPFAPTFMFHEVGHVLGLNHSRSVDDGIYGDRFDIMSAMSVWTYPDAWQRKAGPAATALNLQRLRWLDDDRIHRSTPSRTTASSASPSKAPP
ncbi:hypothetical protein ACH419_32745 [Streptomyces bobili]|uniref:hypothetical protein n=1 Tax=Streptomyces bobili TaxID=67280 RepID=UPI0037B6B572